MQLALALCHFCESHGPRILISHSTTQSAGSLSSPSTSSSSPTINDLKVIGKDTSNGNISCYGNATRDVVDDEPRCNACTSLGATRVLLSNDDTLKTSYISSQISLNRRVYERVKHACARSLSGELSSANSNHKLHSLEEHQKKILSRTPSINPNIDILDNEGRDKLDGHMLFGDTQNGYCISIVFRLQDAKARGFMRLFSLVAVSNDLSLLTSNYDLFRNALQAMLMKLQQCATNVYRREIASQGQAEAAVKNDRDNFTNRMGLIVLKRKLNIDTNRNLETITGIERVWYKLHKQMMWTLRAQSIRYRDRVLEGIPSQNMLVLMEMERSRIIQLQLQHPSQKQITLGHLANLKTIALLVQQQLGEAVLDLLLRHIVTGEQIIAVCPHERMAHRFLFALSQLLPLGCVKILSWKEQFAELDERFNLIGCPPSVIEAATSFDTLVIEIEGGEMDGDTISFDNCAFRFRYVPSSSNPRGFPAIAKRYKTLLLDEYVRGGLLLTTIESSKEVWMNKAKMFFNLEMQGIEIKPSLVQKLLKGNGTNADLDSLLFWQTGLSSEYKEDVAQFVSSQAATLSNGRA
ncbi:hypothetical protein WR25_26708 [Diploscapter pachys]|uniref:Folliculin n=1 Tax=Diploscapter pachys TaxID=2018661 RepID=A0A2A2L8N6_9BILA|nr:hypothetical protein WR25_26708 [Diploscapter pachys]